MLSTLPYNNSRTPQVEVFKTGAKPFEKSSDFRAFGELATIEAFKKTSDIDYKKNFLSK